MVRPRVFFDIEFDGNPLGRHVSPISALLGCQVLILRQGYLRAIHRLGPKDLRKVCRSKLWLHAC